MPHKVFSIHQDISLSRVTRGNPHMTLTYTAEHNVWLNALINNDVDSVGSLLTQADERGKHLLLEGWICDESFWACWSGGNNRFQKSALIQRPISLAAVNGSYGAIDLLYRSGIDMLQSDAFGNNVVHALITHTSITSGKEELYLDCFQFILSLVPKEMIEGLLLAENKSGLRPIELASCLQTYRLMNGIFSVPDIYLKQEVTCGVASIYFYDVTDYESTIASRSSIKSPLYLLLYMEPSKLDDKYTRSVFTKGLIVEWVNCQKKVYLPFVIIWAMLRLLVIGLLYFAANLSHPVDPNIQTCGIELNIPTEIEHGTLCVLTIITLLGLMYDIYDMIKTKLRREPWEVIYAQPRREYTVQYRSYRILQCLLNVALLVICLNRIASYLWNIKIPTYPARLIYTMVLIGIVWSVLYFIQLLPVIGKCVIATQRMVQSLVNFSAIMLIFILPFAFTFPKFVYKDVNGTCPEEYNFVISSFYTSFTVIFNMNDFRSVNTFSVSAQESLWLIHVIYVTLVAILLLNFLIAIFSDSYTIVANNPEVLTTIQWLSIIATLDLRLPRCLRCVLSSLKRKYFTYQNGRIYVKVLCLSRLKPSVRKIQEHTSWLGIYKYINLISTI